MVANIELLFNLKKTKTLTVLIGSRINFLKDIQKEFLKVEKSAISLECTCD